MLLKAILTASLFVIITATHASTQECYDSSIVSPSPFMGNHGEIFKLDNGSFWEVKYEYQYLYEYQPNVTICPIRGKLTIKEKSINVEQVMTQQSSTRPQMQQNSSENSIESEIDGEFSGWEGETIFKLTNGQIWQQAEYAYTYTYKYRPKVVIFRRGVSYQMQVEDMDSKIRVTRLK